MKSKDDHSLESKAMKEEPLKNVDAEKDDDEGRQGKLPGDYPPSEDIMNRRDQQRVGLDVENFSRAIGPENANLPGEKIVTDPNSILEEPRLADPDDVARPPAMDMERPVPKDLNPDDDTITFATGNESDVTAEDLQALGSKDLSMDMGDDEQLKNRVWPVDMAASDLDIPGSEDSDNADDQGIGTTDEENEFYSLGGDRHEDQMEGK